MFKFELGQTVYYMLNNYLRSAPIISRMIVENAHDDWVHTKEQKELWQPFGPSIVKYATVHSNNLAENEIFDSREALAAHLTDQ